MTRDGAFEENRTTGTAERISQRDTELVFSKPQDAAQPLTPEPEQLLKPPLPLTQGGAKQDEGTAERVFDRLDTEHTRHKNKKTVKKANELIRQQSREPEPGQLSRQSSRLQFTDEERADPALSRYIRKSDAALISWTRRGRKSPNRKSLY